MGRRSGSAAAPTRVLLPSARILGPDGDRTADVAVVDGRFQIPARHDGEATVAGLYVSLPLVDAHCHCVRLRDLAPDVPPAGYEQMAADALERMRSHGTGLARDAGDPTGVTIAPLALGRRPEERPVLRSCGAFLTGPADSRPGVLPCADEAALTAAVATQAAQTGWAKLLGDRITRDGIVPTFPADWIEAAAAAAREVGGRVAIHAMRLETIAAALRAGVDSLEHGTAIEPALMPALVASGALWVPTLLAVAAALDEARPGPRLRHELARLGERLVSARAGGVTILAGTDGFLPYGGAALEGLALGALGLAPPDVHAALTFEGQAAFGGPNRLADGALADLVATRDDPRDNPAALLAPELVYAAGRRQPAPELRVPPAVRRLLVDYFGASTPPVA